MTPPETLPASPPVTPSPPVVQTGNGGPDDAAKMAVIHDAAEKAFDAESARTEFLLGKAEKYFAAIAAVAGFQTLAGADLPSLSPGIKVAFWSSFLLLGAAFVLIVVAARVKHYVGYPAGAELYDELSPPAINETQVHVELAKVLLGARATNFLINNRKAALIKWSEYLLLAGIAATFTTQLLARLR